MKKLFSFPSQAIQLFLYQTDPRDQNEGLNPKDKSFGIFNPSDSRLDFLDQEIGMKGVEPMPAVSTSVDQEPMKRHMDYMNQEKNRNYPPHIQEIRDRAERVALYFGVQENTVSMLEFQKTAVQLFQYFGMDFPLGFERYQSFLENELSVLKDTQKYGYFYENIKGVVRQRMYDSVEEMNDIADDYDGDYTNKQWIVNDRIVNDLQDIFDLLTTAQFYVNKKENPKYKPEEKYSFQPVRSLRFFVDDNDRNPDFFGKRKTSSLSNGISTKDELPSEMREILDREKEVWVGQSPVTDQGKAIYTLDAPKRNIRITAIRNTLSFGAGPIYYLRSHISKRIQLIEDNFVHTKIDFDSYRNWWDDVVQFMSFSNAPHLSDSGQLGPQVHEKMILEYAPEGEQSLRKQMEGLEISFLSEEDQAIESEAMVYFFIACLVQMIPFAGAPIALYVDAQDIFTSEDQTIKLLRDMGLIHPNYQMDKMWLDNVLGGVGLVATAFGAQAVVKGISKGGKMAKASKIISKMEPKVLKGILRKFGLEEDGVLKVMKHFEQNVDKTSNTKKIGKGGDVITNTKKGSKGSDVSHNIDNVADGVTQAKKYETIKTRNTPFIDQITEAEKSFFDILPEDDAITATKKVQQKLLDMEYTIGSKFRKNGKEIPDGDVGENFVKNSKTYTSLEEWRAVKKVEKIQGKGARQLLKKTPEEIADMKKWAASVELTGDALKHYEKEVAFVDELIVSFTEIAAITAKTDPEEAKNLLRVVEELELGKSQLKIGCQNSFLSKSDWMDNLGGNFASRFGVDLSDPKNAGMMEDFWKAHTELGEFWNLSDAEILRRARILEKWDAQYPGIMRFAMDYGYVGLVRSIASMPGKFLRSIGKNIKKGAYFVVGKVEKEIQSIPKRLQDGYKAGVEKISMLKSAKDSNIDLSELEKLSGITKIYANHALGTLMKDGAYLSNKGNAILVKANFKPYKEFTNFLDNVTNYSAGFKKPVEGLSNFNYKELMEFGDGFYDFLRKFESSVDGTTLKNLKHWVPVRDSETGKILELKEVKATPEEFLTQLIFYKNIQLDPELQYADIKFVTQLVNKNGKKYNDIMDDMFFPLKESVVEEGGVSLGKNINKKNKDIISEKYTQVTGQIETLDQKLEKLREDFINYASTANTIPEMQKKFRTDIDNVMKELKIKHQEKANLEYKINELMIDGGLDARFKEIVKNIANRQESLNGQFKAYEEKLIQTLLDVSVLHGRRMQQNRDILLGLGAAGVTALLVGGWYWTYINILKPTGEVVVDVVQIGVEGVEKVKSILTGEYFVITKDEAGNDVIVTDPTFFQTLAGIGEALLPTYEVDGVTHGILSTCEIKPKKELIGEDRLIKLVADTEKSLDAVSFALLPYNAKYTLLGDICNFISGKQDLSPLIETLGSDRVHYWMTQSVWVKKLTKKEREEVDSDPEKYKQYVRPNKKDGYEPMSAWQPWMTNYISDHVANEIITSKPRTREMLLKTLNGYTSQKDGCYQYRGKLFNVKFSPFMEKLNAKSLNAISENIGILEQSIVGIRPEVALQLNAETLKHLTPFQWQVLARVSPYSLAGETEVQKKKIDEVFHYHSQKATEGNKESIEIMITLWRYLGYNAAGGAFDIPNIDKVVPRIEEKDRLKPGVAEIVADYVVGAAKWTAGAAVETANAVSDAAVWSYEAVESAVNWIASIFDTLPGEFDDILPYLNDSDNFDTVDTFKGLDPLKKVEQIVLFVEILNRYDKFSKEEGKTLTLESIPFFYYMDGNDQLARYDGKAPVSDIQAFIKTQRDLLKGINFSAGIEEEKSVQGNKWDKLPPDSKALVEEAIVYWETEDGKTLIPTDWLDKACIIDYKTLGGLENKTPNSLECKNYKHVVDHLKQMKQQ